MSTTTDLPRWASDILAAMPGRGGGLHQWLMRAAIALRRCGRTDAEIARELEILTAGEAVKRGEIPSAVERSMHYMADGEAAAPQPTRVVLVPAMRQRTIDDADGFGAAELWDSSPYRLVDDGPDAESIIDMLFPADALLCCAKTLSTAHTAPREEWRGRLQKMQFIVPSPMTAARGLTQEGRSSARCLDNTGARAYLVVEQDTGTADEQAAILRHLSAYAPLAIVVSSGGKSLHGWFRCEGASEAQQQSFFDYAIRLGADPATWTRCQLVRMPEGERVTGARQSLLYLNPEVVS